MRTFKLFTLVTVALLTLFAPSSAAGRDFSGRMPTIATVTRADPALLHFPSSSCPGAPGFVTGADVRLSWIPAADALQQWVDVSIFDNDFAPGTFVSVGPLARGVTSVDWKDLVPNVAHYFRVNTRTAEGWKASGTVAFVPCGSPKVIDATWVCRADGRADVTLRWAAASSEVLAQWVDLSLTLNGFAPDTFLAAGPLPGSDQAFLWRDVLANMPHYYRTNSYSVFGWGPSQTGFFIARC